MSGVVGAVNLDRVRRYMKVGVTQYNEGLESGMLSTCQEGQVGVPF